MKRNKIKTTSYTINKQFALNAIYDMKLPKENKLKFNLPLLYEYLNLISSIDKFFREYYWLSDELLLI